MVTITISTVGFAEHSGMDPMMQGFTVLVILFGVTAATYTFSGFMQLAVEGEINRILGNRRMSREIDRLRGHVVICGYGRTGIALTGMLEGTEFVIVDISAERCDLARENGWLVVEGDATDESVLLRAGIENAQAVVTNLPSDADNVFITLTARNVCPKVMIIARAAQVSTEKKLRQAGADRIVQPAVSGARTMARMVTRPSTAEFIELVSDGSLSDMELDEVGVSPESNLMGMSVRETEARRIHQLLVIGVKPHGGEMIFNPDADYRFAADDMIIIMGKRDDIQKFRTQYSL